jgi:putative ABC transport system permease protein
MTAAPVIRAVAGGLARRRVQTVVIALVALISTSACVLAVALLVDSSAPFDHAFAVRRGAHVRAAIDPSKATAAQMAATTRLPQVTAVAGPFAETTIGGGCGSTAGVKLGGPDGTSLEPLTLAGRASPGGPVDDVALAAGRWPARPGEVALQFSYQNGNVPLGATLTFTGVPGTPRLRVVGIAASVTGSADGWVVPAQIAKLRPPGSPASAQMLYRFRDAGTDSAVRGDIAAVTAALPAGAVTDTASYLTVKSQDASQVAPYVPFVIAFACLGLVLSLLIVANVVSAAVAAGYRRIGILKSIGFTPGQIVAVYVGQAMVPAAAGCLGGVALGNRLAAPMLAQAAFAYGVGVLDVPVPVDMAVPAAMVCLTGIAALLPALRAGRLNAVAAIAAGRAPRAGHGYAGHRMLGGLPLPRPVTVGLAAPFARPARAAVMLAAVLFGAAAVTFGAGLNTSLVRAQDEMALVNTVQISVLLAPCGTHGPHGAPGSRGPLGSPELGQYTAGQQRAAETAIRAQHGTLHYAAATDQQVSVTGLGRQATVTAYRGDAGWTGYPMISGHWYTGRGQADVSLEFLTATGTAVGDSVTVTFAGRQIPVRIAGEIFTGHPDMVTDWNTLASADRGLAPDRYAVGLRPGVSARTYAMDLRRTLGPGYLPLTFGVNSVILRMRSLIGALTVLLAAAAALGVVSTVVLHTRERVYDLGVFKAVGMTPRQAIVMAACWVVVPGLAGGVLAVPAGIALHRFVVPVMLAASGNGVPTSLLSVYGGGLSAALVLAGLVIAAAGALVSAAWAAGTRTMSALRAE